MLKLMIKYGAILFIICLIASAFLSGVYMFTSPRIEAQKAKEQKEALGTVLPQAVSFKEIKKDAKLLYYVGYADKEETKVIGYVFMTDAKGYSGNIEIMAGLSSDGAITGIKILAQAETPGLGARIDEVLSDKTWGDVIKGKSRTQAPQEPWFQKQFSGKRIDELVVVKEKTDKNIQAITGATITSEAVTKAVKEKAEEVYKIIKESQK